MIHIRFRVEEGWLKAQIANSFKPNARNEDTMQAASERQGIGMAAAVENLDLIYGERYRLELLEEAPIFTVKLEIPVA